MSDDKQLTTRTPHANAKAMQRVADAWAMRVRGATWDEVAEAVGYANGPNALRAVRNFVGGLPELQTSELRSLWRERMEFLWPIAVEDAKSGKPGAMRAAVAVAQRAAQLDGLDQPQRVEVSADAGELSQMVHALLAAKGAGATEADIFDAEIVGDGEGTDD
ncbi:hypothetical protein ACTJJ4_07880 [Microbacterium sp. 22195]|uniref:hypothetical protein n=1 Tax=Microbacterium sp. 22195 TaxID=3453891 RepID=UPI003F873CAD